MKTKGFRFSTIKIEYVECEFNDAMHEVGVEVRLDTKDTQEGETEVSWVYDIEHRDIDDDITEYCCGVDEVKDWL